MDYNFTAQDVLNKVIEIGNQFPDYTYKTDDDVCMYTTGSDGQGCIVGQALRALGVPYDVLVEYDNREYGVDSASDVLEELIGEDSGSDIAIRLDRIQNSQDSGFSWGQCVR